MSNTTKEHSQRLGSAKAKLLEIMDELEKKGISPTAAAEIARDVVVAASKSTVLWGADEEKAADGSLPDAARRV